ncbi:hypothetical protein EV644_14715 [Kribbella orskensis]|uniref:DUF2202 domain-containing protein n=2 Tax=Kribbellaceae TaxID=2726069 RepID=A0ABY2B644_9ACTN|nr:hypothetical protein EV642_1532 [Kribbella sp. VKM Ac-2500]TCO08185.1 hypothetical protein EV644_14715 [Kribbella orskensis]
MTKWRKTMFVTAGTVGLLVGGGVAAMAAGQSPSANADARAVTPTQQQDLQFTRDEERMARDLYQRFAGKYDDLPIFDRISQSEQRHFDAVGNVLVRYDIQDAAAGKAAGVYTNPAIQKLYDDWKAQGLKSSDEALKAAIALEERDITDLGGLVAKDNPTDVESLYAQLLAASKHHLSAFTAVAEGDTSSTGCPGAGQGPRHGGWADGGQGGPARMGPQTGMNR